MVLLLSRHESSSETKPATAGADETVDDVKAARQTATVLPRCPGALRSPTSTPGARSRPFSNLQVAWYLTRAVDAARAHSHRGHLTAEAEPLDHHLLLVHIGPCAKLRGQPQITGKVVGLGWHEIT